VVRFTARPLYASARLAGAHRIGMFLGSIADLVAVEER
jgi:hypothetical protein